MKFSRPEDLMSWHMLDRGHPRAYLTDANNAKGSLLTAKVSPKRMSERSEHAQLDT
jgi:hypothetical protein